MNEIQHWDFAERRPEDEQIGQASYETTSVYGFGHPLYYDNVIRTLRGEFFNQPGQLYCTPTALIVYIDREYHEQHPLVPYIDRINAEQHRIPWLGNRLLVVSVGPSTNSRAGP